MSSELELLDRLIAAEADAPPVSPERMHQTWSIVERRVSAGDPGPELPQTDIPSALGLATSPLRIVGPILLLIVVGLGLAGYMGTKSGAEEEPAAGEPPTEPTVLVDGTADDPGAETDSLAQAPETPVVADLGPPAAPIDPVTEPLPPPATPGRSDVSNNRPRKRDPQPERDQPDEISLIASAERELRKGDARGALRLVRKHEKRFATGALAQEREKVRVVALCRLGRRDEAQRASDRFLERWPRSPYEDIVRRGCEKKTKDATDSGDPGN